MRKPYQNPCDLVFFDIFAEQPQILCYDIVAETKGQMPHYESDDLSRICTRIDLLHSHPGLARCIHAKDGILDEPLTELVGADETAQSRLTGPAPTRCGGASRSFRMSFANAAADSDIRTADRC
jgi:hypothetical protein